MINNRLLREFITRRQMRLLMIALGFLGLAMLFEFFGRPLQTRSFPVRFVRIVGSFEHVDKSRLQEKVQSLLDSGYLSLNMSQIRINAESMPWIKQVKIRRIWPDTLVMAVSEHVPFARFGDNHLLSDSGEVYRNDSSVRFDALPLIIGSATHSAQYFFAFQKMQAQVAQINLPIERFHASDRDSWSLQLLGGLQVELGRHEPLQAFERFIGTLSLLGDEQIRSMVRVDLRYHNGYAVEWRPGTKPDWNSFVEGYDPNHTVQSI